jgi:hypothetical protein
MPDWRSEVSRRLANSELPEAERDEISRELAGYLEDFCVDARARGLDHSAAAQQAAAELHEDDHLGARLYCARRENAMNLNSRTKRFWLPGMSMLLASAALLAAFQAAGFNSQFTHLWIRVGPTDPHALFCPLMACYPWLCILPFVGAAGAFWTRRAGGSRAVRTAAQFFSVSMFLAVFLTVLLFSFVISGVTGNVSIANTLFPEFTGAVMSWVVIPAIALLLGVLPFLWGTSASEDGIAVDV